MAIHRYVLSTSCLRVVSIADCTCSPGYYDRVHCEGVELGNVPKVSKAKCSLGVGLSPHTCPGRRTSIGLFAT